LIGFDAKRSYFRSQSGTSRPIAAQYPRDAGVQWLDGASRSVLAGPRVPVSLPSVRYIEAGVQLSSATHRRRPTESMSKRFGLNTAALLLSWIAVPARTQIVLSVASLRESRSAADNVADPSYIPQWS